jgi:hypothetical protein
MSSLVIQSRPGSLVLAWIFLVPGLVLAGMVIPSGRIDWLIGALLPLLLAGTLFLTRRSAFHAELTDTEIQIQQPPLTIPYKDIEGLIGQGRKPNPYVKGPRSYPIQIIHKNGAVWIPGKLDVRSDEVFLFLFQRLPTQGSHQINPKLADYLKRKERQYGAERVYSYGYRNQKGKWPPNKTMILVCLTLLGVGVIWAVCSALLPGRTGWTAGGTLLIIFGLLFMLLALAQGSRGAGLTRIKEASLVISPEGLALIQGKLTGQMAWHELRNVKLQPFPLGIVLKVAGANILILDQFDRPLSLIYQQICYYWRGEATDAEAEQVWQRAEAASKELDRKSTHITDR